MTLEGARLLELHSSVLDDLTKAQPVVVRTMPGCSLDMLYVFFGVQ